MGLVGKINSRAVDSIFEQGVSGRHQCSQVRHRAAADEQTAGRVWKFASATQPAHDCDLNRRGGRAAEPRPVDDIEACGERVRHRAYEIVWPENEREKPRMIDMQIIWKNIAF